VVLDVSIKFAVLLVEFPKVRLAPETEYKISVELIPPTAVPKAVLLMAAALGSICILFAVIARVAKLPPPTGATPITLPSKPAELVK